MVFFLINPFEMYLGQDSQASIIYSMFLQPPSYFLYCFEAEVVINGAMTLFKPAKDPPPQLCSSSSTTVARLHEGDQTEIDSPAY